MTEENAVLEQDIALEEEQQFTLSDDSVKEILENLNEKKTRRVKKLFFELGITDQADLFEKLDKDKNGLLSEEEVGEEKARFFERLKRNADENKDGQISKEEFQSAFKMRRDKGRGKPGKGKPGEAGQERKRGPGGERGPRPEFEGGLINLLDKDGDKQLSLEELKGMKKVFGELDKNQDGKLDMAEVHGRPKFRRGERPGLQGKGPEGKTGKQGEGKSDKKGKKKGQRPEKGERGKQFFEKFDKDGNGTVSKEEAPKPMKKRFDKIDTDGNGEISPEELKASIKERAGKGKKGKGKKKPEGKESEEKSNLGF